jgi:hypothetical protein
LIPNSGTITYILPTQHVAEQVTSILVNEHLDLDQMLSYAASYIEHEDCRAAGCIFEESIADDLYDSIEGFDSDPPGDLTILTESQYGAIRNIADDLANQVILAGKVLKPIIEKFIDFEVYERYTTDECRLICGDLAIRLKRVG